MKKVIHATAVYGPLALNGIIMLFLLTALTGWFFIPYNGYIWCGICAAVCVLVCLCVKLDDNGRSLSKIEENGILVLAISNTVWWIYIWSTVKYTVVLPFAAVCVVFTIYLVVKLCGDTVKRTLGLMVSSTLALIGLIIWTTPLMSPAEQVRERFNVYNEHSIVAKVTVVRDAGNVYNISVVAKKTGRDLGIGRFENSNEASVYYQIVDTAEYKRPELVWQGDDLYFNGQLKEFFWD